MQIYNFPQHYIDWESVGGYEKFMADYKDCPDYTQRRILIESLPLQTNPDWLKVRQHHITASKSHDFLGMDRTGTKPGASYKKVIKQLVAEQFGWVEPEKTWNEKSSVKRGILFERRAVELFEQATGIKVKTDIGFISTEIDGLPFGCSPDGYVGDIATKKFDTLVEIKSFELQQLQTELEELDTPKIIDQMQQAMAVAKCPECYKILYCAELDKIFYRNYKRAAGFSLRLKERIPLAKEYESQMIKNLLGESDLTNKTVEF